MQRSVERRVWQGLAVLSGAAAAMATRRAMTMTWRAVRHEDPPLHPSDRGVQLTDAVTWAIATAVGMAVSRVLAERAAASGWRSVTGAPPPELPA